MREQSAGLNRGSVHGYGEMRKPALEERRIMRLALCGGVHEPETGMMVTALGFH